MLACFTDTSVDNFYSLSLHYLHCFEYLYLATTTLIAAEPVLSLLDIRNSEDNEEIEITIFTININNSTVVFEEHKPIHIPGHSLSSGD